MVQVFPKRAPFALCILGADGAYNTRATTNVGRVTLGVQRLRFRSAAGRVRTEAAGAGERVPRRRSASESPPSRASISSTLQRNRGYFPYPRRTEWLRP